jgi:malonyl CoA-acyl carrier protein transacylase
MPSNAHEFMFIFPGQGAQYRGMGNDLYSEFTSARRAYDRASDVLGLDMAELSFSDPSGDLDRTDLAQVALLTHSIACLEVFNELTEGAVRPAITAGHSLGEYSALVAAGALSFEDALLLVRARGAAMAEHGRGRMVALRLGASTVRTFVDRFFCGIGGCNLPEQTVVGGAEADLRKLVAFVSARHGTSALHLDTRGAFHTYLMTRAAEEFRPALDSVALQAPRCRVLANYSGTYHSFAPEAIRAHLFFQIFHPVRWMSQLQRALSDGAEVVIEFGGGVGPASHPAGKVPNLQGITRCAVARSNRPAIYRAAISAEHVRSTARFIRAYSSLRDAADDRQPSDAGLRTNGRHGSNRRERWSHLYVPTVHGLPVGMAVDVIGLIADLDLTDVVQIIADPVERNVETLRWLGVDCAEYGDVPQPYLEVVYACEAAAVLYYVGAAIAPELCGMANRPARPQVSAVA